MTLKDGNPVALVTGGTAGIGRAIAGALARDGYYTILSGTNTERGEAVANELGGEFRACDLRDASAIAGLVEALPPLDAVINNAGVAGPTASVEDVSQAEWQEVLDVNLTAPFLISRGVLPAMRKARSGVIVNISSVAGRLGYANRAPYAVSKWGLHGLTMTLAREAGSANIRVNAVLPGPVRGERIEGVLSRYAAKEGITAEEAEQHFLNRLAIKRFVEVDEIAELVAYLCSDSARSVSGQLISVDGALE